MGQSALIGFIVVAVLIFLAFVGGLAAFIFQYRKRKILHEKEKQLVALNSLLQGQELERARMAKDLHDGLGGMLSGVKLSLSSMKGNQIISEEHAVLFQKSILQLDSAISEMRRVAHNMMPEALLKFGLADAVNDLCQWLSENGNIRAHFEKINFDDRLSSDQEVVAYRMIQELVNNAIKHSACKSIIVQLSKNENIVQLLVEDDGKGFDTGMLNSAKGMGYENLNNRVDYLKGTLSIKSEKEKGTSVMIEFPAA